ncbi:hypothetical protein O181_062774 [Austropuccinia psidii MF-1]|uniref:Uncharacterized protein n=1 Tax=Austropuccinia psidii MF-1 TaxID=1389203 RepID=A0A9Q3I1W0_9BASI|nr:hypothetical protein [Austropuccinia psidii MF-1]
MAIEDPEKWLALELSGMNKEDKVESPQKKFKMDLKPPEANSSGIAEDYLNLFQEETRYISDIDKDLLSQEPKDNIINLLEKRKFEELENESAVITEDKMNQVWNREIKKGIQQRMEIVPEGKLVKSEDHLKLYQQNNGDLEDKYKQGRIFEDLEEVELSENTQRLPGLSILQEFNDAYDHICCFSSSTDLFNQNKGITSGLTNDSQNQNGIHEDIPEYEGEEDYVILPMITFEDLYDYELYSPIIQAKYLAELPGSNLKNFDFLELVTTIGIKGNLCNPYWKKPYGYYQLTIEGLYHRMLWAQEDLNLDCSRILGGTLCWCDFGYMFINEVKCFVSEWKGNTQREQCNKIFAERLKEICLSVIHNSKLNISQ